MDHGRRVPGKGWILILGRHAPRGPSGDLAWLPPVGDRFTKAHWSTSYLAGAVDAIIAVSTEGYDLSLRTDADPSLTVDGWSPEERAAMAAILTDPPVETVDPNTGQPVTFTAADFFFAGLRHAEIMRSIERTLASVQGLPLHDTEAFVRFFTDYIQQHPEEGGTNAATVLWRAVVRWAWKS